MAATNSLTQLEIYLASLDARYDPPDHQNGGGTAENIDICVRLKRSITISVLLLLRLFGVIINEFVAFCICTFRVAIVGEIDSSIAFALLHYTIIIFCILYFASHRFIVAFLICPITIAILVFLSLRQCRMYNDRIGLKIRVILETLKKMSLLSMGLPLTQPSFSLLHLLECIGKDDGEMISVESSRSSSSFVGLKRSLASLLRNENTNYERMIHTVMNIYASSTSKSLFRSRGGCNDATLLTKSSFSDSKCDRSLSHKELSVLVKRVFRDSYDELILAMVDLLGDMSNPATREIGKGSDSSANTTYAADFYDDIKCHFHSRLVTVSTQLGSLLVVMRLVGELHWNLCMLNSRVNSLCGFLFESSDKSANISSTHVVTGLTVNFNKTDSTSMKKHEDSNPRSQDESLSNLVNAEEDYASGDVHTDEDLAGNLLVQLGEDIERKYAEVRREIQNARFRYEGVLLRLWQCEKCLLSAPLVSLVTLPERVRNISREYRNVEGSFLQLPRAFHLCMETDIVSAAVDDAIGCLVAGTGASEKEANAGASGRGRIRPLWEGQGRLSLTPGETVESIDSLVNNIRHIGELATQLKQHLIKQGAGEVDERKGAKGEVGKNTYTNSREGDYANNEDTRMIPASCSISADTVAEERSGQSIESSVTAAGTRSAVGYCDAEASAVFVEEEEVFVGVVPSPSLASTKSSSKVICKGLTSISDTTSVSTAGALMTELRSALHFMSHTAPRRRRCYAVRDGDQESKITETDISGDMETLTLTDTKDDVSIDLGKVASDVAAAKPSFATHDGAANGAVGVFLGLDMREIGLDISAAGLDRKERVDLEAFFASRRKQEGSLGDGIDPL